MSKTKYLNEEPFKEKECPDCHKTLRQTRVRIGKNGLKCYRIWVHKESRKRDCYREEETDFSYPESNHKPICQCGHCKMRREVTGQ